MRVSHYEYHPRIGDLARPVLVIHVLAAFVYGAGYIGTNVLTELARRTDDPLVRRHALHFSGVFDRRLNVAGGTVAGITGVLAVFVFGYSLLAPWVLATIVIYVVIVGTGIFFWAASDARSTERQPLARTRG